MKLMRRFSQLLWPALCLLTILLMVLSLSPANIALANPGDPGTGPGGVDNNGGTGTLRLWLMGNKGIFSNSTCTTSQSTNGGAVGCWKDQSGYTNDVIQAIAGNQPTYQGDQAQNSIPVIQFGDTGTNYNYLERDAADVTNQPFTVFVVSIAQTPPMTEYQGLFASHTTTPNQSFQLDIGGSGDGCTTSQVRILYRNTSRRACSDAPSTNPQIIMATLATSGGTPQIRLNGGSAANGSGNYDSNFTVYRVGAGRNNISWPNDIAEAILFYKGLNNAERILVENYLQAKYNNSTTNNLTVATDVYDGDTTANGDFDKDVAGIGRASATEMNTTADSAGMIIANSSFLQNNGDYLMFGHKNVINISSRADLPAGWPTANPARWWRHWYIKVTDAGSNGGNVSIGFDISEGGLGAICSVPNAANYRLLKRATDSGAFAEVTTGTPTCSGDVITFPGVSVGDLGSNFTVATTNNTDAPLGPDAPTAVTMSGMTARPQVDGLHIEWSTAMELDVYGFDVYRSTGPAETPVKLNAELIPAQAIGGSFGADYSYIDATAQPGVTYYYWLEVQQIEGPERFGPQEATMNFWRFFPLVRR
jgi:hypothetical protein